MHTPTARRSVLTALAFASCLSACTPQAALVSALIPSGTINTLLGNLERVADDNRRRVVELDAAGRWDDMARLAEQNLAKDAANADWWLVSGYARSQAGRHHEAARAFSEVVRLEPDSPLGWNLLAQSHRALGDSERAVVVLNNALLALRDSHVTEFLLGESYSDLGRFDDAAVAYQQALARQPRFAAAWAGLARAYERSGRRAEAQQVRARIEKMRR